MEGVHTVEVRKGCGNTSSDPQLENCTLVVHDGVSSSYSGIHGSGEALPECRRWKNHVNAGVVVYPELRRARIRGRKKKICYVVRPT
jgi:hypothetical protein